MTVRDFGLLFVLAAVLPAVWLETVGWRELPEAPQTVYLSGVPHTERSGTLRTAYDRDRSFFPIGLYHALTGEHHGYSHGLSDIAAAGFNTVHFWERQTLAEVAGAASAAGLQIVYHNPSDDEVRRYAGDPVLLSWYLNEEPALRFSAEEQLQLHADFARRREVLHRIDPDRPVHIIDGPPGDYTVWDGWATTGDIVAFSVYPARTGGRFSLGGSRSIAESVARALRLNDGRKPVWFVAQAFSSPSYGWRMPTAAQYRAMVYTAVVHGATGVITFAYDSFVTRDGQVLGIAPSPLADYGDVPDYDGRGDTALAVDEVALMQSRSLWRGVARVNHELAELAPALLSPTVAVPYDVSVLGLSEIGTPVRTLLKHDIEGYVLIVVNLDDRSFDVRLSFDGDVAALRRPFAPEGTFIVRADGWQSRLEPYETQVYRFELQRVGRRPES